MTVRIEEFSSKNPRRRHAPRDWTRWAAVLLLSGALAATLMTLPARAQADRRNPHGEKGECASCHLGGPPGGVLASGGAGSAGGGKYPLRLATERAVCERCHDARKSQTHPGEIVPTIPIPAGWPLNSHGQVTCSTCHDPHQATGTVEKPGRLLLRGEKTGLAFCQQCHDSTFKEDSRTWHIAAIQSAHIGAKPATAGGSIARADQGPALADMDAYSARCIGCHDGMFARDAQVKVGRRSGNTGSGSSHPIAVVYPAFSLPGKAGQNATRLHSRDLLDKRILLFDNKVSCLTCHDLYSKDKHYLVLKTEEGKLCLSCHDI